MLLTSLGAAGSVLPPVVRRGEPVCPGREAGRRASAAGPWMAHRCVPWDKRVNRGNPTQEGEQVGVAFLLVTFLWPRKEKSLAQARRAGETPSRAAPSCPAWRSQAIQALGDIPPGNDVSPPHPNLLPQGERGLLPADDYASLIDPTGLLHPAPHPVVGEAHSRCLVPHPSGC